MLGGVFLKRLNR